MTRLLVLAGVALAVALVAWAASRWQRRPIAVAVVPDALVPDSPSWLVLTTPWCASCGPVVDRLEAVGSLPVVVVDLAERPEVSRVLDVRQAPTVLRVEPDGAITERAAGPAALALA